METKDVIAAIRAMAAEAKRRGAMYPQTYDAQEEDWRAVRRVIGMLEFYAPATPNAPGWNACLDKLEKLT